MSVFLSHSKVGKEFIIPYTQGLCHVFAIALHRRFGTRFFVTFYGVPAYWNVSVYHVYALDRHDVLWDITGRVEKKDYVKHIVDVFSENAAFVRSMNTVEFDSERGMKSLVKTSPESKLEPLMFYSDTDIGHANDAIEAAFGSDESILALL